MQMCEYPDLRLIHIQPDRIMNVNKILPFIQILPDFK